jgi:hypothetical protein
MPRLPRGKHGASTSSTISKSKLFQPRCRAASAVAAFLPVASRSDLAQPQKTSVRPLPRWATMRQVGQSDVGLLLDRCQDEGRMVLDPCRATMAAVRPDRRRTVGEHRACSTASAERPASLVFCRQLFEHCVVEDRIRQQLLQPGVLFLKHLQLACPRHVHSPYPALRASSVALRIPCLRQTSAVFIPPAPATPR